jgi:probable rRNA maturation factor
VARQGQADQRAVVPGLSGEARRALPPMLGDIVLAAETVAREAELEEKPFEHHLSIWSCTVCCIFSATTTRRCGGRGDGSAGTRRILARLAIPDPYA